MKKNVFLISLVLVLGTIYVVYFTDWFNKPSIAISPRIRVGPVSRRGPDELQVSFSFDGKVKLTDVKVFSVTELETNKYPHEAWHLITETNSIATKGIVYGQNITGMKPKIPKMKAEPLLPGTKYRLLIEAGKRSGQADFEIPARQAAR